MVDMIMDPKGFFDHLNDTGAGPEIRRKAGLLGPSQQDRFQPLLLPGAEPRRSAPNRPGRSSRLDPRENKRLETIPLGGAQKAHQWSRIGWAPHRML